MVNWWRISRPWKLVVKFWFLTQNEDILLFSHQTSSMKQHLMEAGNKKGIFRDFGQSITFWFLYIEASKSTCMFTFVCAICVCKRKLQGCSILKLWFLETSTLCRFHIFRQIWRHDQNNSRWLNAEQKWTNERVWGSIQQTERIFQLPQLIFVLLEN